MSKDLGQLFEYAVLFHPVQTKADREAGVRAKSKIIVKPTTIVAHSENEVQMLVAREIPAEYADKLDQVQVAIRPF